LFLVEDYFIYEQPTFTSWIGMPRRVLKLTNDLHFYESGFGWGNVKVEKLELGIGVGFFCRNFFRMDELVIIAIL
jgi:hypothetical protein